MRVMHLIHGLNTGGAETLVKNYFLNFDKSKNDVVLLCMYHINESPYEDVLRKAGVRIIFVEDFFLFSNKRIARKFNRLYKYFLIRRIVRKESPDILHTHMSVNSYVRFANPKKSTTIFHTIHTNPKALWDCSKKGRARDLIATRWLVKHRDMRFIVLHEKMRKEINEMFGRNDTIVLDNGVDVEKINNAKNSKIIRKELGIPEDILVLGHIGRFSKVKNQEFLVDVFKEVHKKNGKAFLLMVGDGPDKAKIAKKLNSSGLEGCYLILSNRSDISDLLSAMDVFVFPSLYEGLPLSLIEAQIARKPCFVSDRVDESATISNLVTGLPLKNDASKWVEAILSYEKPKKGVVDEKEWDIKKITKRLEQIYLDTLAGRQNGKK